MYCIIDTNLLYYWSNIQDSIYSPLKISDELKQYDQVYIPIWALIEILANSDISIKEKQKIFEFIAEKKLPVHGITIATAKLIPSNILVLFQNDKIYSVIKEVHNYKFSVETDMLAFLVKSAVSVLGIFFDYSIGFISNEERNKFDLHLEALLKGNSDFITQEITSFLNEFYQTNKETNFKNNLENFIYSLFYVISLNFNISSLNKFLFSDTDVNLTEYEKEVLNSGLKNKVFHNKIWKKLLTDKRSFITKEDDTIFEKALAKYVEEMSLSFSPGFSKYTSGLLKKIFTSGAKLTKNDTIDSLLLNFYPGFQLLTAENRIRNIIVEFDAAYGKVIDHFIVNIKK